TSPPPSLPTRRSSDLAVAAEDEEPPRAAVERLPRELPRVPGALCLDRRHPEPRLAQGEEGLARPRRAAPAAGRRVDDRGPDALRSEETRLNSSHVKIS